MRLCASVRLFAGALLTCAMSARAVADGPRPSWECLPDDTLAMLRIPDPPAFLETLRTRTKLGAVALGDARLTGAWDVLLDQLRKEGAGQELTDIDDQLAAYGLEQDDLRAAFRGDVGAGLVFRTRADGRRPLEMMLAWLEPGEETATRLVQAAQRQVEKRNAAGEIDAPRRIDVDLAGHEVLWLVEPVMTVDSSGLDVDEDDVGADDFEERLKARLEAIRERARNGKFIQTGQIHTFLARVGSRLLVGNTIPTPPGSAQRPANGDFDAESGGEEAKAIFEKFLTAHAEDGESPLVNVMQAPGMAAALPAGIPLSELIIDPRVAIRAWSDDVDTRRRLESIGAADIGPLAWRQSLEEGQFHSGLFVSLPAPRRSLMQILDQDCDPAEVPSFVTREAIDITQISLDLGKAYETVKEFAVGQGGEETANMFLAVEMQAQGWLGIDVPNLLTSLGSRHWIVSYPPRIAEALTEARAARGRGAAVQQQVADRVAVVWQIADEAPFEKILQRLAGMAGGGGIQEEQGFRGIRIPDGPAIFMGQGHLVVAIGSDSLEKTLTAIRNPPAGEASLRESDIVRRAATLVPLEPARVFGVSDSSRSGGTLGMLRSFAAAMVPDDVDARYRDMLAGIQKLLPSEAEMEGMFGVGATLMRADDAGVSLRSVWEMPAP
jgi:hypothetical protein